LCGVGCGAWVFGGWGVWGVLWVRGGGGLLLKSLVGSRGGCRFVAISGAWGSGVWIGRVVGRVAGLKRAFWFLRVSMRASLASSGGAASRKSRGARAWLRLGPCGGAVVQLLRRAQPPGLPDSAKLHPLSGHFFVMWHTIRSAEPSANCCAVLGALYFSFFLRWQPKPNRFALLAASGSSKFSPTS